MPAPTHPKPREVYIAKRGDSWMVLYAQRRKGQRYSAAQFYAKDWGQGSVEGWVRKQPNLDLIPAPATPEQPTKE